MHKLYVKQATYHHSHKKNSRQPSFSGRSQLQVALCRIQLRVEIFYWSHLLRVGGRRCRGSQRRRWHSPSHKWTPASSGTTHIQTAQGPIRSRGHPHLVKNCTLIQSFLMIVCVLKHQVLWTWCMSQHFDVPEHWRLAPCLPVSILDWLLPAVAP